MAYLVTAFQDHELLRANDAHNASFSVFALHANGFQIDTHIGILSAGITDG
ncbi:hypothetical protein A1122_02545 [Yersinia pestis A1122]|nr:hypothetical protein A1122_02545 [Yersinia pestis A1122]EKS48273.1 hypothetical protein INS_02585 [Yersinia pestis INS]